MMGLVSRMSTFGEGPTVLYYFNDGYAWEGAIWPVQRANGSCRGVGLVRRFAITTDMPEAWKAKCPKMPIERRRYRVR